MKRRTFLAGGLAAFAFGGRARAAGKSIAEAFDHEMETFMSARKIPGGALAVVKDRRLVYARGYGVADREKGTAVSPDSILRIASIAKPVTAIAVLKLIEEGKLSFDQRAFEILKAEPLGKGDSRLAQITIRQLLQHTGGWDRNRRFDPMFRSREIAAAAGVPSPAGSDAIIRYMLGQPLEFAPGTRYAYSNFGYCVLGRIIEKISGRGYESFVRESVLAPMGISRMKLGATLEAGRAEGEVRYYVPDDEKGESVFAENSRVPYPYGCFCLEAMDAHGGWIASAVDLARFAAGLDDRAERPLLKKETLTLAYEPPPAPVSRKADGSVEPAFYGCGWMIRPVREGRANYWHEGSLPGTATLLVRRWDGLSWAALFNQRSSDNALPDSAIDGALHRAAAATDAWPTEDLFTKFA